MACEAGKCIAGRIGSAEITENDWERANKDFDGVIEVWNEKTRRFAIPHPGYVTTAKFCVNCGRKLDDHQR